MYNVPLGRRLPHGYTVWKLIFLFYRYVKMDGTFPFPTIIIIVRWYLGLNSGTHGFRQVLYHLSHTLSLEQLFST
jgi:hypothetical protein